MGFPDGPCPMHAASQAIRSMDDMPPPPPPPTPPPPLSPPPPPPPPATPQCGLATPVASSSSKKRRSVAGGSSRRRSATPLEHIATLEHQCKLNDHERVGYESRVAQLEAELFNERQSAAEAESSANERVDHLERALERQVETGAEMAAELERLRDAYAACQKRPGLPRCAVRAQRPRMVRVPRTYSTWGPGGKAPCASGTYPTREAGTRGSPYVPHGGGIRVSLGHRLCPACDPALGRAARLSLPIHSARSPPRPCTGVHSCVSERASPCRCSSSRGAPCTLHPAPCTLHPASCILHPAGSRVREGGGERRCQDAPGSPARERDAQVCPRSPVKV